MELVSLENLEEKKKEKNGGGSYLGYIDTKRYRGMRKKDRKIREEEGKRWGRRGSPASP